MVQPFATWFYSSSAEPLSIIYLTQCKKAVIDADPADCFSRRAIPRRHIMPVNADYLLPSAKRALERVASAQATGVIHTDAWVRELCAYAPETSSETDQVLGENIAIRSFTQAEFTNAPVLYLPSTNVYARRLEEFVGAARYIAEALQRSIHLVDPSCSADNVSAHFSSIAPATEIALLVEGQSAMRKALKIMETEKARVVKAVICIHPGLIDVLPVQTYRVDEDPKSTAWAGIPPTPLAIIRWIPEICTYLDAIRPWLNLRVS